MNAEVERAAHAATVALSAFDRAGVTTVLQTVPALAQTLRELLVAMTSPPADDVREALAAVIEANRTWKRRMGDGYTSSGYNDGGDIADAILSDPRFEVRLRGTVTEPPTDDEIRAARYRESLGDLTAADDEAVAHTPLSTEVRPYSDAIDIQYAAWEVDDIEEHALDMLAVVAHRRAEAAREARS